MRRRRPRHARPRVEPLEARQLLTTYRWLGGTFGPGGLYDWDLAANWFNEDLGQPAQGVPGAEDTARIVGNTTRVDLSGDVTVGTLIVGESFRDPTHQIQTRGHTLTFGGGAIDGGWLWGDFVNTGTTTVNALVGAGHFPLTLTGTLTNAGTIVHESGTLGTSILYLGSVLAGTIVNTAEATLTLDDGVDLGGNARSVGGVVNRGAIVKAGGPGTAALTLPIDLREGGTIRVDTGTLQVSGNQHRFGAGTLATAEGATLRLAFDFIGGTSSRIVAPLSIDGSGTVLLSRGELVLESSLAIAGAPFVIDSGPDDESVARLAGAGTLDSGTIEIRKGRIHDAVLTNRGTIRFRGQNLFDNALANSTLLNEGTLILDTPWLAAGVSTIENRPEGRIEIARSGQLFQGMLRNLGTIRQVAGVESFSFQSARFINRAGTIKVDGGRFDLTNTLTMPPNQVPEFRNEGATLIVAPGATLDWHAGNFGRHDFAGTFTATGGGAVHLGAQDIGVFDDVILDGAPGMIRLHETQAILGSIENRGDLTIESPTGSRVDLVGDLTNLGTIRVTTPLHLVSFSYSTSAGPFGRFFNRPGATFETSAAVTFLGGGLNVGALEGDNGPLIRNQGQMRLGGDLTVNAKIDNEGPVEILGRAVMLFIRPVMLGGDLTGLSGEWVVRPTGVLRFGVDLGASFNVIAGHVRLEGPGGRAESFDFIREIRGSLTLDGGASLTIPAHLTNSGAIHLGPGSTLSTPGGYTQTPAGLLETTIAGPDGVGRLVVGGSAALAGQFRAGLADGFEPAAADRFVVVEAGQIVGDFSAKQTPGFVSATTGTQLILAAGALVADLVIEQAELVGDPRSLAPGEPFQVRYTVRNAGTIAAEGPWSDIVHLDRGLARGPDALLVGVSGPTAALAAGASTTITLDLVAPIVPGTWNVFVTADRRAVVADPDRANNLARAAGTLTIQVPELPLGGSVSRTFRPGETTYYALTIPEGTGPVRVTGLFGAADGGSIRVTRAGMVPAASPGWSSDSVPSGVAARRADVDLTDGVPGVYHVAVTSRAGGLVTTSAEVNVLTIDTFDGFGSIRRELLAGDTLTLTLRGSGFGPATDFTLGGRSATRATVLDPATAIVTFADLQPGAALALEAHDGTRRATAPGEPFRVVVDPVSPLAQAANWTIWVEIPSLSRPFREIPLTVWFRNDSAVSQPTPILSVVTDNGTFRLPSTPGDLGGLLGLLGVKATGRPDPYAPGEWGSIELMLWPDTDGIHVTSDVLASILVERQPAPAGPPGVLAPLPGPILLPPNAVDAFRPDSMDELAWQTIVRANVQALVGTTYEQFANTVRYAAARLADDGQETRLLGNAIGYLVGIASDFGAISRRFERSAFGFGVENPNDVRLAFNGDGSAVVRVGFLSRGFVRFGPTWIGLEGDRGTIAARPGGGWLLTEADGSTVAFRPDGQWGFLADARGNRTIASYEGGRRTAITDPFGNVTRFTHDNFGNIATLTDPDGRLTRYFYDPSGRFLIRIDAPTGTTTYAYSPSETGPDAFAITRRTEPNGVTWHYQYDAFGRLARVSQTDGQLLTSIDYGTGADLGTVMITEPRGGQSTFVLGAFGQVTSFIDPTGRTFDYRYDRLGRLIGVRSAADDLSIVRDARGQVVAVLGRAGVEVQTEYALFAVRPTSLIDPLGRITTLSYNDAWSLTAWAQPNGNTTTYAHDTLGRVVAETSPIGLQTRYEYDPSGRLAGVDYPDGSRLELSYDAWSNLIAVAEMDPLGVTRVATLTYDAAGRVTSITDPNARVILYEYDAAGRLFRTTADGVVTERRFDALGRLAEVVRDGVVEVTFSYDAAGDLAARAFANGARSTYTYDPAGRPLRVEHRDGSVTLVDFQQYAYDAAGRTAALTTPEGTTHYERDARGQLVGVILPDGSVRRFDTDALGNRLGFTIDDQNRYLSDPEGRQYQYDPLGNLTAIVEPDGATTSLIYDIRNRLVRIETPADTIAFEYDPLGHRSAVIRNGVRIDRLIDPVGGAGGLADLLAEYLGGERVASYLIAEGPLARFDALGHATYAHHDAIGNTVATTDAAGSLAGQSVHLPFGERIDGQGDAAVDLPFRYHGFWGVIDHGVGLLEMRARFYAPALGRFTQPDPIGLAGGDLNLYRFVTNAPLEAVDPSGKIPFRGAFEALKNAGTAAASNTVQAVTKAPTTNVGVQVGGTLERVGNDTLRQMSAREGQQMAKDVLAGSNALREGWLGVLKGTGEALALTVVTGVNLVAGMGFTFGTRNANADDQSGLVRWINKKAQADPRFAELLWEMLRDGYGGDSLDEALRRLNQERRPADSRRNERVAPFDPNDITGPDGVGPELFRQPGGVYRYTIRFQNKPEATAPAQEVFVTQQLDPDLDWSTFRLESFGWADYSFNLPAGLQSYTTRVDDPARGLIVEVLVIFDAATGALSWTIRSLDPVSLDLPDDALAGFLPPDDATGRGQGFVRYTVQPQAGAETGTRYDAQASIVFDTEAAILTNVHTNHIDATPPVSRVESLPAASPAAFVVRWGGTDAGSGIRHYEIWVQAGDGPWERWLGPTAETSATFVGMPGTTYRFLSVASDQVGHVEAFRPAADSFTTVRLPADPTRPGDPVIPAPLPAPTPVPPIEPVTPTLVEVRINGGAVQRSWVTHIDVEFNTIVHFGEDAFRLIRFDGLRVPVVIQASRTTGGRTVVTLRFAGPGLQGDSLRDGRYLLVVDGDRVRNARGGPLPTTGVVAVFHRLFGDLDGNSRIDRPEVEAFRSALQGRGNPTRFEPALDANGNQRIDRGDAEQLRRRLGRQFAQVPHVRIPNSWLQRLFTRSGLPRSPRTGPPPR